MKAKDWTIDYALLVIGLGALLSLFFGLTQARQRMHNFSAPFGQGVAANPFFQFYSLALIAATLALPWLARAVIRRSPQALVAIPLAALCFFTIHWRHGMHLLTHIATVDYHIMNPEVRVNLQASSPALDFVRQQPGAFRTVGFGDTFYPGYNALMGLESIYGTDPLINPHYRDLLTAGGIELIWTWRWVIEEQNLAATLPLYRMLNTRYFLEYPPGTPNLPLKQLARLDLTVYEDEAVWPRAFFVDEVGSYEKVEDFVRMIREGDGHPFAAVQRGSEIASPAPSPVGGRPRQVVAGRDYRLTTNRTRFTIEAPGPGVVVLTEAYMPEDFIVEINHARADYFRINHAFRGVKIPQAGTYDISFSYWPKHFTASLLMAGLGLALLAGWLLMVFRPRKIPMPAPSPSLEPLLVPHD